MNALIEALADHASGRLTEVDLEKVATLHRQLEDDGVKTAAGPGGGVAAEIGKRMLESFGRGIEHAVPLIVAGLGVTGVAAGGRALMDKATHGRDLKSILDVYPHLKENYSKGDIDLAYSSMRHLNPHLAKDPLAGGTLLGQMLRSRDPMNPKSLRFEPQLAGDLLRLNPRAEHAFEEVARDAAMRGVQSGMEDSARSRTARGQQAFMREQEEGRRAFDLSRDAAKSKEMMENRAHDERMSRQERVWRERDASNMRKSQMGLEAHKARLKERSETGRRAWETSQKSEDHKAQDRRAVLSAVLNKSEADRDFYATPVVDPMTGQPMIDPMTGQPFSEHHFEAPPQISAVLSGQGNTSNQWVHKNFPHIRP